MALCTLSDLKSWLGIDALDTSKDTILTMIINSVSKKYENYCNTKLEETTIVNELYEGSGNTNSLVLNNLNVSKVNKIEFLINDVWETVYEYKELPDITIDTYGMTIENSLGLIKMNCLIPSKNGFDMLTSNPNYTVKYPNVRVSYVCGFNPVPSDLSFMCIKSSARQFTQEIGGKLLVQKEEVFNAKTWYETDLSKASVITNEETQVLNEYKRWV